MKKEKIKKIYAYAGISTAMVFVVVGLVFMSNVGNPLVVEITEEERIRKWEPLPYLGDADPGVGTSGVIKSGIVESGVTWTANLTAAEWYEYTDVNNTHAGSDVPYDTNVYLWWHVRLSRNDLLDNSSNPHVFNLEWVNGWVNCTDLSITALEMTEANITGVNAGEFIFVNFYAGPYQWARDQNITGIQGKFRIFK